MHIEKKLDDTVDKNKNACYSVIKMKFVDAKSNNILTSVKTINKIEPKCKVGDNIRMKKTFFCKRLHCKFVWRRFCDETN